MSAVDLAALREQLAALGSIELLRSIVDTYLNQIPERRSLIAAGTAAGDADAIRFAAHTLRPSSAMLGLSALADACSRLQREPGHPDLAARVLALLDDAPARLAEMLATLAREGGATEAG